MNPMNAWLDARFLERLVAAPRGRAFMLSFMADAEDSDEAGVFDALLARVDDPALQRLVRRHRDDEKRHAGMLRDRLAALGLPQVKVPAELRIVERIDRQLGGLASAFVDQRSRGIMEAYALLLVVEERAVRQFPAIARAFAKVDAETGAVVSQILDDERRHVRYAQAVSRKYAPDEATLARTLRDYRAAEELAFEQNGHAMLRHVLDHGLLDVGAAERLFWRGLNALGDLGPRRHSPPVGDLGASAT